MQRKINLTRMICLLMEKITEAPSELKVTTPENLLLSITSGYKYKESYQTLWPIPKYQPIVEPLPQNPIHD